MILHKWYIVNFFYSHRPVVYRHSYMTYEAAKYALDNLRKSNRMVAIYQGRELSKYKLSTSPVYGDKRRAYTGINMGSVRVFFRWRNKKQYGEIYNSIVNKGEWSYPPKVITHEQKEKWRKHCRRKWKRDFIKLEGMTEKQINRLNPPPKDWWPNHKHLIPKRFSHYLK